MKKLTLIAALLVLGVSVQAAAFNWGGHIANDLGVDGEAGAGTYATLIFMGTAEPGGTVESWNWDTGLTNLGGTVMDTYNLTAADLAAYQFGLDFARTDPEGGVNGWWMVVVYDPSQTPDYFGWHLAELSGISDTTSAGNIRLAGDWGPGEYLDAGQQYGAVPEPTSMALLALGVAAVGLRRRFRK